MADKKLRPKYLVFKVEPDGTTFDASKGMKSTDPDDVDSPFVLMPRKDPAAFAAMITYARYCEKDLAKEIKEYLQKVARAPGVYGTQGGRNRQHLK
ncbi:unnamed protein product, partial [marine sediment metagenome]